MSRVFVITENNFCVNTAAKGLLIIPIDNFIDALIKFSPLKLTFSDIAASCDTKIDQVVIVNTLSMILELNLRVRAFSLSKDIVAKQRQKITLKKSLRKTIKHACDGEDTK